MQRDKARHDRHTTLNQWVVVPEGLEKVIVNQSHITAATI